MSLIGPSVFIKYKSSNYSQADVQLQKFHKENNVEYIQIQEPKFINSITYETDNQNLIIKKDINTIKKSIIGVEDGNIQIKLGKQSFQIIQDPVNEFIKSLLEKSQIQIDPKFALVRKKFKDFSFTLPTEVPEDKKLNNVEIINNNFQLCDIPISKDDIRTLTSDKEWANDTILETSIKWIIKSQTSSEGQLLFRKVHQLSSFCSDSFLRCRRLFDSMSAKQAEEMLKTDADKLKEVDEILMNEIIMKYFKKKKIIDQDLILLPYNENSTHWLLIALMFPSLLKYNSESTEQFQNQSRRPMALVLDSEAVQPDSYFEFLFRRLVVLESKREKQDITCADGLFVKCTELPTFNLRVSIQKDGNTCGYHTIYNSYNILRSPSFSVDTMFTSTFQSQFKVKFENIKELKQILLNLILQENKCFVRYDKLLHASKNVEAETEDTLNDCHQFISELKSFLNGSELKKIASSQNM